MKYRATCYSEDGTTKYVFDTPIKGWHRSISSAAGLKPRHVSIESAFIQLPKRTDGKPEFILCLSSQAGCAYSCLMCANMFSSFYGCLSPKEIDEQIRKTLSQDNNLEKIKAKNAVEYAFMAMGEPLYGMNVIKAIQTHKQIVSNTRFSLATIGATGTIDKLTKSELPYPTRLELSLHFSNDETRNEWMQPDVFWQMWFKERPKLTINDMLNEAEKYSQKHPEKITLNYALIDGINNTDENIEELSNLLKGKEDIFYVKVMKPNMTSSLVFSYRDSANNFGKKRRCSKFHNPKEFRDELMKAGVPATIFESKGTDIAAGCGMMTARFESIKGKIKAKDLCLPQADPAKLGFRELKLLNLNLL